MLSRVDGRMNALQNEIPLVSRHYTRWALGVAWLVLVVYLASISSSWFIGKDSALYLSLARNWERGDGYTLAGKPHLGVPPGLPALLATILRLGGGVPAMNSVLCALGLATLAATFMMLRQWVHRDWALLLTGVAGLSREMVQRSSEILSDVPFMLLVVLALWLYGRGLRKAEGSRQKAAGRNDNGPRPTARPNGWEAASLLLVASCWVRVVGFPLIAAAALGLLLGAWRTPHRRRAILNAAILGAGAAATLAYFFWFQRAHPDPDAFSYLNAVESRAGGQSLWAWVAGYFAHFYAAAGQLSRLMIAQEPPRWLCLPIFVAPIVAGLARRVRQGDYLGPLIVTFYVGALCATGLRTRYLLPVGPLLLLYLAEGFAWFARRLVRQASGLPAPAGAPDRRNACRTNFAPALMAVLLAFNMPMVARSLAEKRQEGYGRTQQKGIWAGTWVAAGYLREHRPTGPVLAIQPVGYLADVPCILVSTKIQHSSPDAGRMEQILKGWDVQYVVLDLADARDPSKDQFVLALLEYFRSATPIVAQDNPWLRIYRVELRGAPVEGGATGRGDGSQGRPPGEEASRPSRP